MTQPAPHRHRFTAGPRGLATIVAAAFLIAACGGGGGSKKAATPTTTGSTVESAPSTTAAVTGDTATVGSTTSTTVGGTSATTVRRSTSATTARKATVTTVAKGVNKAVTGGIGNVVATTSTAPRKDIQPGGTLTMGEGPDIATGFDLNQASTGQKSPQYMAVFDFLVYTDPSDGGVKGQIADSLTSTDGLVWSLKIKPNVKFSDGTAYDAAAVKFSWARLQDPANAASTAGFANLMQTMDVVDATTLRITLKTKNSVFPQAVAQIPFVGSPTAFQAKGTAGFANSPVGAGPFVLKEWLRDDHLTFVRNPTYWNAPRPYIDQLILKPIIDETQRINTFLSGAVDTTYVASVPNAANLTKNASAVPYASIINGGIVIDFNTTAKPFNDIRARQAIAYAIDRSDYVKVVDNGVVEPQDSAFRHDSPFYDPNVVQLPFDPVKAQQLFDQVAADNGGTLSFNMSTFNVVNYMTAALYVQGILNNNYKNVKVNLVSEVGTTHTININNRNYQAGITGSVFIDPEPQWTGVYTCNANPAPTGWCSAKFDAAVADNRVTLDAATRIKDIKDAQSEFYAQVPALYIERRYSWKFTAPKVQDYMFVNDNNTMLDRLWIKTH